MDGIYKNYRVQERRNERDGRGQAQITGSFPYDEAEHYWAREITGSWGQWAIILGTRTVAKFKGNALATAKELERRNAGVERIPAIW